MRRHWECSDREEGGEVTSQNTTGRKDDDAGRLTRSERGEEEERRMSGEERG